MNALRDKSEIDRIYAELLSLFTASWAEVGKTPFKPQENSLKSLWRLNLLEIVRVEHGYAVLIRTPHIFDSLIDIQVISVFIEKDYRNSATTVKLFRHILKTAKAMGGDRIMFFIGHGSKANPSFRRFCGEPLDVIYRRNL